MINLKPQSTLIGLFIFFSFFVISCGSNQALFDPGKMNGLTVVAPPEPFKKDPFDSIKQIGANWVAFVPYAFQRKNEPNVRYPLSNHQWWGETPEGITESILQAKLKGLKIMLKPQIYIPGGFTGDMKFENEKDWLVWEESYSTYILTMAKISAAESIELFCIGTEFRQAVKSRPQFWVNLIDSIKNIYSGSLTYASNWDEYQEIPFWNQLDYIGVNAYFPLTDNVDPDSNELMKAWTKFTPELQKISSEIMKPILFTEYGYLSVEGAAGKQWEVQDKLNELPVRNEAQRTALEALYNTFYDKNWWKGGFLWKWFPEMKGHEGYPEKDYTPQGKPAMETLKNWFKSN